MKLRNMKKWLVTAAAAFTFMAAQGAAEASTVDKVQYGESIWELANKYGVPVTEIKKVNNKKNDMLYIGENLTIPTSPLTPYEKDLLARLVNAEAKGESYAGKVAVATVVLNRVESKDFPNTIKGVIYQISNGHYAFTPVQNGAINQPASAEAKRAVNEAIAMKGLGNGSLFFYNPKTAKSHWIASRTVTTVIGNHVFAK
ncbi:cell wall hydrolase [Bacillus songklensis]|uniref:Cell wall hydrolase n=1 Tax=Bacillus songklensis TaxID=1069116 RepID=A0ABV8BA36_9BACI